MQVVVARKDLIRVLERCQGVADKKSTMPVLGNVLLEVAGPDQLRVAATDLYLAVSGNVPAKVEKGGLIAVGARDLYERVKNMPEAGQVSISTSEGSATTIRSVGTARRYTLHGIPGDEFPSLPQPDETAPRLELGVDVLQSLINGTAFSISGDETRLHLNSALFEWDGDRVRMVTTDGHRLSKAEVQVPGKHATSNMLIPQKGILELRKLCEEAKKEAPRGEGSDAGAPKLELCQSGPNVFFNVAGLQFSVKLVDAQFPPYQQVIPDQTDRAIRVPRGSLDDALRAVRIAASDRTGGVKLNVVSGKLRLSTESPESGEGFDEVNVDYEGPEVTVGFNASYILDVLGSITDDEVILGVSGELDPCVIRPGKESTRSSYLAVVMPMRI